MRTAAPIFRACLRRFSAWTVSLIMGAVLYAEPAPSAPEKPPIAVSYVYPHWQEAKDFRRISEYFTGRENTGGDIILRTDATNRTGMYFRIGLPFGTRLPARAQGVIECLRADSPELFTRVFDLPALPEGPFAEIRLGLTGKDWTSRKLTLVAWRFTLRDDTGKVLAQEQSFLWSMPRAKAEKTTPRSSASQEK